MWKLCRAWLIGLFFLVGTAPAYAVTVKIAWDATDQGQKGFKLYWGEQSRANVVKPGVAPLPYDNFVVVNDPAARFFDLELDPGTWYFRATAFNDKGESDFSNEASLVIEMGAPSNLRITVIGVQP